MRGVAEVWLGHLRNHQGRPVEALELLDHALRDPDRLAHPFAPLHGRFARIMALGHLGRVADALRACDELDAAVVRAGAYGARFPAIAANMRAWLQRSVGRFEEADDGNRFAAKYNGDATGLAPAGEAMAEGFWVALLDLVEGRLLTGDLDGAAAALERCAADRRLERRHGLAPAPPARVAARPPRPRRRRRRRRCGAGDGGGGRRRPSAAHGATRSSPAPCSDSPAPTMTSTGSTPS